MVSIALIAHNEEKTKMIELAKDYEDLLEGFKLYGTAGTSERIMEETSLTINAKKSGPLGGDTQIAAKVAEGEIDAVIFLIDSMTPQPHEPDISALLRICDVYNVPLASNKAGAKYLLRGLQAEQETPSSDTPALTSQ